MNQKKKIIIVAAVVIAAVMFATILIVAKKSTIILPASPNQAVSPQPNLPQPTTVEPPAPLAEPVPLKVNFQYPYPVSWEEGGAKFSLTGVSLGEIDAPSNPNVQPQTYSWLENFNATSGDKHYQIGEKIYALTLILKITTDASYSNHDCLSVDLRRVLNEEGDLAQANSPTFALPNGCIAAPNATYANQKLFFVVPDSEKEFTLTTGGNSNIFFSVKLTPEGKLNIENLSAETQG